MLLKDIFLIKKKVKYLRKIDDDVFVGLSFGNLIIVKTKIDLRKNNQKIALYFL